MRWLIAVVACMIIVPVVQAQDVAQKLYETMEQKLAKAKGLKFGYGVDVQYREGIQVKGTLILATGNRRKLTFEGLVDQLQIKGTSISDGKTLATQSEFDGQPKNQSRDVDEKLQDMFTGYLSRFGVFQAIEFSDRKNPMDASLMKLFGFKMLPKEKVASIEANVIEYHITPLDRCRDRETTCKLWLDAQTTLPLKRLLEVNEDNKFRGRIVETYSQWELDPKLPEGTFTLPK